MSDHSHANEDGATAVPEWALAPFRQCLPRLRDETRFMHLAWTGLERIRVIPDMMKFLSKPEIAKLGDRPVTDEEIERAQDDANWVDAEARLDFPLLHSHCSVSLWGI